MLKHRSLISATSGLLLTAGVIAGAFFNYATEFEPSQALVFGLVGAFAALYLAEFFLLPRYPRSLLVYLPIQTAIAAWLLLTPPLLDTFAILFIAVLLQITPVLGPRWSLSAAVVFALVAGLSFLLDEGFPRALGQIFVYAASYLLVTSYNITLQQLEKARDQLQAYLGQAEELAVVKERNRMARELHDSVAQTIFGMTFTAEAARDMLATESGEVRPMLDRLLEQAQAVLAEMRELIFDLRPARAAQEGLVAALTDHLQALERRGSLNARLNVRGEERLSPVQAHRLFRIAQEALNNVIKHAGVDQAEIELDFSDQAMTMSIIDAGRGFEPGVGDSSDDHLGIASMNERAHSLDGNLAIESRPGRGTSVRVEVPLAGGRPDG